MKSFLVIGLGRFGSYLAKNLAALGNEVMAIDRDEEKVLQITPFVTAAQVGDCQEEGAMEHLGVTNFDVCFVCINDDFQGSLEVTWALKEQGARYVVARADRERQIKFLKTHRRGPGHPYGKRYGRAHSGEIQRPQRLRLH